MKPRRLVIIGAGPAGYAAAIYAARAQLEPLVLAGEKAGGQLMLTTKIENYPGFAQGILGPQLMMEMRQQAEQFGAEIIDRNVTRVDFGAPLLKIYEGEHEYQAEAVILATGAESIPLGVPGERDYSGRGVSYCAVCDAAFFKEKRVMVVGGGDAAMEDTLALIKFAKKITLIHRREAFRASKIMQERVLKQTDKVEVWWNSEVVAVKGDGQKLGAVVITDTQTGKMREEKTEGLFVAIGHKPTTGYLGNAVRLDEKGYVVTRMGFSKKGLELGSQFVDEKSLVQYPTMTSVEGVFAGGDNVDFRYRQAVTAAGMGVQAALDAEWWLERR